jgi:hypothetical protein
MSNELDALLVQAAELDIEPEMLDDLVHETKSEEAATINNGGLDSQLEYLVASHGADWMRQRLLEMSEERM